MEKVKYIVFKAISGPSKGWYYIKKVDKWETLPPILAGSLETIKTVLGQLARGQATYSDYGHALWLPGSKVVPVNIKSPV